jgi:hypothetical protein
VEPDLVVVGLVAAPGPCAELAEALLPDLTERIAGRISGVRWEVRCVSDRLVEWPADLSRLVSAAHRRALAEGWQLAVCVTDLPLEKARRPVVAHASMTHGVAVLSLPALGPVAVTRRASAALVRLIAALLGGDDGSGDDGSGDDSGGDDSRGDDGGGGARTRRLRRQAVLIRRAREIGGRVELEGHGFGLVAGVVTGNIRLLLGMLRANRPWRLALRLSDALVAALAVAVFALVAGDVWRIADGLGPVRLGLLALGSVVAVVLSIVLGAGLWERVPAATAAREQVILFNVVTVTTVVIGVLSLYLALFTLTSAGTLLLIPGETFAAAIGHPTGLGGQLKLAWLACSLATLGGALGAAIETDEAVREAAYGYQPDRQLSAR